MELKEKLKKILTELNIGIYEKERIIRLTLLSILAGESTFMLGEPGTAKSLIARRISEAFGIEKKDFFYYLMNQFSEPNDVFGPVSIQKLKNDEYERKTENYLPKAKFAFLDEIWKANPAIQNALLTILNEREFRNNGKTEKVDLIGFVSASNELPAKNQGLEAIFDRFLVRILEKPISDSNSFLTMISDSQELSSVTEKITLEEIKFIAEKCKTIALSKECYEIILRIKQKISAQNQDNADNQDKWFVSDRRWKKIVNLMRVSALCNGKTEVDIMDATLIADCIWQNEKQEEEAKAIIKEALENYGLKCQTNFESLKQKLSKLTDAITQRFYKEEITPSMLQKVTKNGVEFYSVKDSSNNNHLISIKPHNEYYSNRSEYYYDGTAQTIEGNWIENQDKFQTYYHSEYYTIVRTTEKRTWVRDDFYTNKQDEGKLVVKNFNESNYNPFYKLLSDELSSINQQIEECDAKYNDNLFTDNFYYVAVITKKLTESKIKIKDLIKQLEEQKGRYEIY